MNYYTFNELANQLGCVTYRELTAGTVTVCRKGRTVGVIYPSIGQVKLVLTNNKQSAVNKLTATDGERLINHKIGDMFEIVECND